MSTSAQHLVARPAAVERRFYRRIVPSSLIYIPFGGCAPATCEDSSVSAAPKNSPSSAQKNVGMLLNLSENGLLVSTPLGLTRNFVYRVSIPLQGLPTSISVRVRVVWTNESKRAGIQMLDLSEHDREQIRKWAGLGSGPDIGSEPPASQIRPRPSQKPTMPFGPGVESPKKQPPAANAPSFRPLPGRTRATSAKRAVATSAALLVAGLATAMFFGDRPLRKSLADPSPLFRSKLDPAGLQKNSSAVTRAIANPSGNEPEAGQVPLPVVPTEEFTWEPSGPEASSDRAISNDAALNNTAGSLSNLPAHAHLQPKIPARKIDWDAASKQPAHLGAPGNLDAAAPPTDLLAQAPSEIDFLPAAPFAFPPPPRTARAARIDRTPGPVVVSVDNSKRPAFDLAPTKSHAGVLRLPGEQVFESASVTMHVQRSILMPADHPWSPFGRSRKVLVGELLSRIDPQLPHFPVRPGSSVTVRAIVDKNGRVETLKPVSGPMTLVPNVARAVREWRYEPTLLDGKPVETESYVLFEFHSPPSSPL